MQEKIKLYLVGFLATILVVFILFVVFSNLFPNSTFLNQTALVLKINPKTYSSEKSCPKPIKGKVFDDYFLANVSPKLSVPFDYVPDDLIKIEKSIKTSGFICVRKDTEENLYNMFMDAKKDGFILSVTSGFRRFEAQESILKATKAWKGDEAYKSVALPGHSEHQLGVAVDLSGKSVNYASTVYTFGNVPEGKWLVENSYKYGFILSYPKGKESITGYIYEPWHFRYVGVSFAKEIFDSEKTIVEYLAEKKL